MIYLFRIHLYLRLKDNSDREIPKDLVKLLRLKNLNDQLLVNIPDYINPFVNRNWELHNIGTPNFLNRLTISLVQIEVKYYEEYLKTNSHDLVAREKFNRAKEELESLAKNSVYVD